MTPQAKAPHGTLARYQAGCHAACCRTAARDYARKRRLRAATGQRTLIDAEPARRHVAVLRGAGLSPAQIAELADVPPRRLGYLIYGDPGRGKPPTVRIRPEMERRLLAISPIPRRLPPSGYIDGTGTRRRLQALIAIGWDLTSLATHMDRKRSWLDKVTNTDARVHVTTAHAVRRTYAELWNQPGPSARARTTATQRRWPPPLAWDDDTIDNPAAKPALKPRRRDRPAPRHRRAAAVLEDSDELLRQGLPLGLVAQRLNLRPDSLRNARKRARRNARTAHDAAEGSR